MHAISPAQLTLKRPQDYWYITGVQLVGLQAAPAAPEAPMHPLG